WKDLPDPKDRIHVYDLMVRAGEESSAGAADRAIATLREVLAADPEVIDAWFLLCGAWAARRDWAHAEEACRKTLAKMPDPAQAALGLADVLSASGRAED